MSALIANHVTSGMVVVVCWWLAHSEARSVPPGRLIAVCYSIVGLSVLMTAIGRGAGFDPYVTLPWFFVFSKGALAVTLGLLARRRYRMRKLVNEAVPPA